MPEPKVYIYWDNSNIFLSAKVVASEKEGEWARDDVRINLDNLYRLAHANRAIAKAIAVGSIPPEHKKLWDKFQQTGVEVELYERGSASGKEQGVDQCLQVHMLRDLSDNEDPQIVVLLTGDGDGYEGGHGFHADLERMAHKGWGIEVIAWDRSCRKTLKEWALKMGSYIKLEDHYEAVTFVKDLRWSGVLNLTRRPKSNPRILQSKSKQIDLAKDRRKKKYLRRLKKAVEQATSKKRKKKKKTMNR